MKLQWDQRPLETKVPHTACLLRFSLAVCAGPSSWWEGYSLLLVVLTPWWARPPKQQCSVQADLVNDSGRVEVELTSHGTTPMLGDRHYINVCEAGLALCLAFSCLKVPSEPLSRCEPTEDMRECTNASHCLFRSPDRQLPVRSYNLKRCLEPLNRIP